MPQRLPTTSPLATVQLSDHRAWVRTDDDTLWLAPSDSTYGHTWGYNGTTLTRAQLTNARDDDDGEAT